MKKRAFISRIIYTASEKSAHANNPSTRAISGSEATLCQTLKASKADGLTSIETTIECIRTLLPGCNCHIASQSTLSHVYEFSVLYRARIFEDIYTPV